MLCPLLIDPQHPVITDRFKLMAVQPSAFPGAKPGNEPEPEARALGVGWLEWRWSEGVEGAEGRGWVLDCGWGVGVCLTFGIG